VTLKEQDNMSKKGCEKVNALGRRAIPATDGQKIAVQSIGNNCYTAAVVLCLLTGRPVI